MVRGFLQRSFIFPAVSWPYGLKVTGRENLAGIDAPVLFVSNHHLGLDNPLIIKAVPWASPAHGHRRGRQSLEEPHLVGDQSAAGQRLPGCQGGRGSPQPGNMGKIIDDGWSVLIYPEGGLTVGGPVQPFMNGIGLAGC